MTCRGCVPAVLRAVVGADGLAEFEWPVEAARTAVVIERRS